MSAIVSGAIAGAVVAVVITVGRVLVSTRVAVWRERRRTVD